MAIIYQPKVRNLELSIAKDTANADFTIEYDIDWSDFDVQTGLVYHERFSLIGIDPASTTTLWSGPLLARQVSANGGGSTHRTFEETIAWADLNEDVNNLDEIAAVVTLTPQLPEVYSAQSARVVVDSH